MSGTPGGEDGPEGALHATPTESFLADGDDGEREAAIAAVGSVLSPASVAVVGASRDPTAVGGLIFANLLRGRFRGPVYPVNPEAAHVQSVAAYPSLEECPTVPEMVVVCVPAPVVRDVVEEAGRLGARAAVIISAGFGEVGGEGARREAEVVETARRHGVRLIGPNCMGVLNAGADVRMNATFSRIFPPPGQVAFLSQSGALGMAILSAAARLDVGLTSFASVGNKVDLSGNDFLQYWENDPDTDVVLLYLESFGNPRKFGRLARRIGRSKPIVAVKSGRSRAGERAASSHTGALAAGDVAVDALFHQAGVIRVDTLEEMFDVASLLVKQPVPRGSRVAVLTNGGGPGILAADACEAYGLQVPELGEETLERLRSFLPPEAGVSNPVDMIASASDEDYRRAMRVVADDPAVDAVLVIFVPPLVSQSPGVARAMAAARREMSRDLPVLAVFMHEGELPGELKEAGIPSFPFPENAARALGRVADYGEWRSRPLGHVVQIDADVEAARRVVSEALPGDTPSAWLDAGCTQRLLASFGIRTAAARVVHTPDEAAAARDAMGGPVAVKSAAPVHKTELGGVALGLDEPHEVADAVRRIAGEIEAAGRPDVAERGFLVQEMVGDGVEMAVGVSHDPTFGPLLMAGTGGTLVELLGDVSVRIHPLTDVDVEEMLTSLKGYPLLTGYRGSEPVDVDAFKELLFRMSALVEAVPEIAEMDLNPVFVRRRGVVAVDARIQLSRHVPRRSR